jgi:hypothetical protein
MIFRLARKPRPSLHEFERDPSVAHARVRDHWASCLRCRSAAAASASLWCELGLELMKRGIAKHPHWEACGRCREAQEQIQSGQCNRGRELEHEYRILAQRSA